MIENMTNLKNASYVILIIAAIFLINAMEPGSIGAPWPIGITLAIAGVAMFGYAKYRLSQMDKKE